MSDIIKLWVTPHFAYLVANMIFALYLLHFTCDICFVFATFHMSRQAVYCLSDNNPDQVITSTSYSY